MNFLNIIKKNYKFFIPFLPILALFVVYPIPPIVDYIGHIAFSIVTTVPKEFYINNVRITYGLVHWILKLPQFIIGNNFLAVSSMGMIFMFFTLLSIPAVYVKLKKGPVLFVMGALVVPTLFIIHTKMFIWGEFPFALGAWLSVLFILIYNHCDSCLAQGKVSRKLIALSIIFLALAIFSHPIAILYISLGLGLIILKILFIKSPNKISRLSRIAEIIIFLLLVMQIESYSLEQKGSIAILWGDHNFWERILNIARGSLYDLSALLPIKDYFILGSPYYISFMSLLPFIALALQTAHFHFLHVKKEDMSSSFLIFGLLLISSVMLITIPTRYQFLTEWPERNMLFILPLILIILSESIMLLQTHFTTKRILPIALVLFFLLSIGAVYVYLPLYSDAQQIKTVSDEIAIKLADEIEEYKKSVNHTGLVVVVYTATPIVKADWFSYRLVPFILMANKDLMNKGIIIQHEWSGHPQVPLKLNTDYLEKQNVLTINWDQSTYPKISLSPI